VSAGVFRARVPKVESDDENLEITVEQHSKSLGILVIPDNTVRLIKDDMGKTDLDVAVHRATVNRNCTSVER